ncbi:MAG: O-antigen ligase family protein [Bdellovibrionales bacterium]
MRAVLAVLLCLYVVALHTSIAAMETVSWLIFVLTVGYKLKCRSRFNFPHSLLFGALAFWVALSLAVNPPLKDWIVQLGFMRWTLLVWGFAWALDLVWSDQFEKSLLRVWMGVLIITGLYAGLQFLTGVDFVRGSGTVVDAQGGGFYKATGFFSMSLTFAYAVGASTLLAWTATRGGRFCAYVRILAGLSGGIGVIGSMSRGAWIAFMAAMLGYAATVGRRFFAGVLALMGATVVVLFLFVPAIHNRITAILHIGMDHSSSVRVHLWRAYWEMAKDNLLLGVGLFQGDRLLPQYYERLGISETFTSHAHNVLLQWLAGAGLPALFFYLSLSVLFLVLGWKLRNKTPWALACILAQVYIHIGGLTEANFFDGEVNHMITFIWGLTSMLWWRYLRDDMGGDAKISLSSSLCTNASGTK